MSKKIGSEPLSPESGGKGSSGIFAQLRSYFNLTLGSALMAAGIYFFKFPSNFSTGGVSGISTVLSAYFLSLSKGGFVLCINLGLLALGLLVFGRKFAVKTVYSCLLVSGLIAGLEWIFPMSAPFTDQKLLELIFAILLEGAGSAILFNEGASSGGTDIVAMIVKKYFTLDIGKALFCTDLLIIVAAGVTFGIETGMYSLLGLLMKAFLVDNVIDSINLSKCFHIVTSCPEQICGYIIDELHRSATVVDCHGAFSNAKKGMVFTVLNRAQAASLKAYIREVDPSAFVTVTNSSDIMGKGFRLSL